jgi:hypothetical protein
MNNNHHQPYTADAGAAQVAGQPANQPATPYQQIKFALDVHAATIVVVPMLDGAKPQPPQTMKPTEFPAWVQKQKAHAEEVVSCYEAGSTGFWLHRRLTALGVRSYVVCPMHYGRTVFAQLMDWLPLSQSPYTILQISSLTLIEKMPVNTVDVGGGAIRRRRCSKGPSARQPHRHLRQPVTG